MTPTRTPSPERRSAGTTGWCSPTRALASLELQEGAYRVRFARSDADLDALLRLRFAIFHEELGEGLESSWATGRDEDAFDRVCDHLMLEHVASGELVGTYRMQTARMAADGIGFYCAQEFDLSSLTEDDLATSIELGRACISETHRNGTALYALWRGLAVYLTWTGTTKLFGCCSLTSQDPREGMAMLRHLESRGKLSTEVHVEPLPGFTCTPDPDDERPLPPVDVPRLFGTYLRYGALACGPPAIDRAFRTIDFFIVLDSTKLDPRMRAMFFLNLPRPPAADPA